MAETHDTTNGLIAEAREKYTVHNCDQCILRKSCDLGANGFDSDECRGRRQSIMLGFGIEDGYFTKFLDRLEAAHKRERGDGAKLREAIEAIVHEIGGYSTNGLEVVWCSIRGETIRKARAALAAPPRNCDRPECAKTKAAQDVWRKEDGGKTAYYEWLLATYNKGDNNGNE